MADEIFYFHFLVLCTEWCEGLRIRDLHWGRAPTACLTRSVRREGGEGEERGGVCLVEATHDFPGSEAGELQLEKGDVVKIVRQMAGIVYTCTKTSRSLKYAELHGIIAHLPPSPPSFNSL